MTHEYQTRLFFGFIVRVMGKKIDPEFILELYIGFFISFSDCNVVHKYYSTNFSNYKKIFSELSMMTTKFIFLPFEAGGLILLTR